MGFTRENIADEAAKTFQKFTIEDGPNGEFDLISIFRAPRNVQEMVRKRQQELETMQDDESEASIDDLHEAIVKVLEPLASSQEDLREYVQDFPTSDLLTLYRLWGEQTQATKSD